MKILAVSDVHGRYENVTRKLEQAGDTIELLLVAGDITGHGSASEAREALLTWRRYVPAIWAVAGNMDSPAVDAALEAMEVSLNACARVHGDLVAFGCSAAPVSIGTPYEIPEEEIQKRIEAGHRQATEQPGRHTLFMPHAPPHGLVDVTYSGVHAGSRAVRRFIEQHPPELVVCGHIHEARGEARLGKTHIVNCGPANHGSAVLIELDDARPRITWL